MTGPAPPSPAGDRLFNRALRRLCRHVARADSGGHGAGHSDRPRCVSRCEQSDGEMCESWCGEGAWCCAKLHLLLLSGSMPCMIACASRLLNERPEARQRAYHVAAQFTSDSHASTAHPSPAGLTDLVPPHHCLEGIALPSLACS